MEGGGTVRDQGKNKNEGQEINAGGGDARATSLHDGKVRGVGEHTGDGSQHPQEGVSGCSAGDVTTGLRDDDRTVRPVMQQPAAAVTGADIRAVF